MDSKAMSLGHGLGGFRTSPLSMMGALCRVNVDSNKTERGPVNNKILHQALSTTESFPAFPQHNKDRHKLYSLAYNGCGQ